MTLLGYIITDSFDGDEKKNKGELIQYFDKILVTASQRKGILILNEKFNSLPIDEDKRSIKYLIDKLSKLMVRVTKEKLNGYFYNAVKNFYSEEDKRWMKNMFSKKKNCDFNCLRIIPKSFRWANSDEGHLFWLDKNFMIENNFFELLKTKI